MEEDKCSIEIDPSAGDYVSYVLASTTPNHKLSAIPPAASPRHKLKLALAVRRVPVAMAMAVTVAVVVGLALFFNHGHELHTYAGSGMTSAQRNHLLDKYNGYAGNVASAIGLPLELAIVEASKLFVLRFLTSAMLQSEPKWYVSAVTLVVRAVLGLLVSSGFDALNVQLRDLDLKPMIHASDLAAQLGLDRVDASGVTSVAQSFSESQPHNSIANTLLRTVVLPLARKAAPQCTASTDGFKIVEDAVTYGFQKRAWMEHVLPQALDATTLRIVLNATNPNATATATATTTNPNATSNATALPMDAARAADLFLIGTIVSARYIPWGKRSEWQEFLHPDVLGRDNRTNGSSLPAAIAAGLLPATTTAASEIEQREFFVRALQTFFHGRQLHAFNTSQTHVEVEFAHVDVSPRITFDAMTWRVEADPALLTTLHDVDANDTRRYANAACGPWPGVCFLRRLAQDPEVTVHAFAACANDDGSETLQSLPTTTGYMLDFSIQCPRKSNASLLLVGATRQLTADAVLHDTRVDATHLVDDTTYFTAVNPRKFYSFTVSRLGWEPVDLATKHHAACGVARGCMGLDVDTSHGKSLVTGIESLPLDALRRVQFNIQTESEALAPLRLVTVVEPPLLELDANAYDFGDYLLRHNVGESSWNGSRRSGPCFTFEEDREQLVLNNHVYMESTSQTMYTAGVFFLFQHAALRDRVVLQGNGKTTTLAFDGNTQDVALWVSIPTTNAALTGIGCVLLVAGGVSVCCWPSRGGGGTDTMEAITTPHVVARVLIDERSFSPYALRCRVTDGPADLARDEETDAFEIETLTLQRRQDVASSAWGV